MQTVPGLPRVAGNTDTSFLKIVALIFMIIDHMGVAFFSGVPELRVLGSYCHAAVCLVPGGGH